MTLFDFAPTRVVPVGEPRTRATDPATSHAAARSITPGRTERLILAEFARFGWLNDSELCQALPDCHPPTVISARSRLSKAGRLVDTGTTRPSRRGRQQIVWKLGSPAVAGGHDREQESH